MFLIIFLLMTLSLYLLFFGNSTVLSLIGTSILLGFLLMKFLSISSHILLMLLMLEFFMLSTLFIFVNSSLISMLNTSFFLTFFTLMVCEASLGLGLLIFITRKTGQDLLSCM